MSKIVPPFVRSPYNYDVKAASDESGLDCQDESLAQQNFKAECDINTIVQTFTRTGDLPIAPLPPQFGDFSGICDFHSALNSVFAAQEAFMGLPAHIRSRFENDPQNLIAFLDDPANREEAVSLGLVQAQDLSTPAAKRAPDAGDAAGVDKSVSLAQTSQRGANGDVGGGQGGGVPPPRAQ